MVDFEQNEATTGQMVALPVMTARLYGLYASAQDNPRGFLRQEAGECVKNIQTSIGATTATPDQMERIRSLAEGTIDNIFSKIVLKP